MKIFRLEWYRLFINHKGLLLVLLCLLLKLAALAVLPETKDARIRLSQRQYNLYMADLYGADNADKQAYIDTEYHTLKTLGEQYEAMQSAYQHGQITEDEWEAYNRDLRTVDVRLPAISIFYEKLVAFRQIESYEGISAPAYFYDYGWRAIFNWLALPDVLALLSVLIVAVQAFGSDIAQGSVNLLRVTRHGRERLFWQRTGMCALSAVVIALLHSGLELLMFVLRMSMNDAASPLYSLPHFAGIPIPVTIAQGLAVMYVCRIIGTCLLALLAMAFAILCKSIVNTLLGVTIITVVPFLFSNLPHGFVSFTYSGFLTGTEVVRHYAVFSNALFGLLPAGTLALATAIVLLAAMHRYTNGQFQDL